MRGHHPRGHGLDEHNPSFYAGGRGFGNRGRGTIISHVARFRGFNRYPYTGGGQLWYENQQYHQMPHTQEHLILRPRNPSPAFPICPDQPLIIQEKNTSYVYQNWGHYRGAEAARRPEMARHWTVSPSDDYVWPIYYPETFISDTLQDPSPERNTEDIGAIGGTVGSSPTSKGSDLIEINPPRIIVPVAHESFQRLDQTAGDQARNANWGTIPGIQMERNAVGPKTGYRDALLKDLNARDENPPVRQKQEPPPGKGPTKKHGQTPEMKIWVEAFLLENNSYFTKEHALNYSMQADEDPSQDAERHIRLTLASISPAPSRLSVNEALWGRDRDDDDVQ